jgi:hypothetical protein
MTSQQTGNRPQDSKRVSLDNFYRAGLTPEQDAIVWKTAARHLLIVFAVALAVRAPYYLDGFRPLNDGGMFALILDHLRVTGLRWPLFIDYNHLHIPLEYPPLGFYFSVLATYLPMQNTLLVMTWLPLLFNLATVAAAYFIAQEVFEDPFLRMMTAVVYSVIGWSAMWLTMGGGITRSPGEFFALASIALFLRSCNRRSLRFAMLAGVFGGLTVMTHLESSVLIVASLPFLAAVFPRPLENLARLVVAGCVGTFVALPWILWIWTHLGFGPMVNALHSGADPMHYVFSLWVVVAAALILSWAAHFPYVMWFVVELFILRRNPHTHNVVIRSIILVWIASVLVALFPRFLRSLSWKRAVTAVIAVAMALPMSGIILWHSDRLQNLKKNPRAQLSVPEREAMQAVPSYAAPGARFIVLSERTEAWYLDFPSEWFPYYSGRQCLNTVQGREWLPDRDFAHAVEISSSLFSLEAVRTFDQMVFTSRPDYLMVIHPMDENHEALTRTYQILTQPAPVYKNQDVEVFAFDKAKLQAAAAKYAAATSGNAIPR